MTDNGGKVRYKMLNGHYSTAYLDDISTGVGTNKYTDDPVKVIWDEDIQEWVEVEPHG